MTDSTNERPGSANRQTTLNGGEAERVECEYYDGCKSPALFIDEILHYGEGEKSVKMCKSCADEHTEVEGNAVQRLKPEDRYVTDDSHQETVFVVVSRYADDPHPHVDGVYDNEDAADEHMASIRDSIKPSAPIAWQKYEMAVESDEVNHEL